MWPKRAAGKAEAGILTQGPGLHSLTAAAAILGFDSPASSSFLSLITGRSMPTASLARLQHRRHHCLFRRKVVLMQSEARDRKEELVLLMIHPHVALISV